MAKNRIDMGLLLHAEVIEYERLLDVVRNSQLSERDAHRLLVTALWYWGSGIVVAVVALVVAGIAEWSPMVTPLAMITIFILSCVLILTYTFQGAFALDRQRKLYLRAAEQYLETIGFHERTQKPKPDYGRSDATNQPHWWVGGYDHDRHGGVFSSSDRANMNEWGMDADTYIANVLENDRD